MKHRVIKPKIVSGGEAVPLGANYYYMQGRKHKNGGIKIGKDAKKGLEVEDEEVMHLTNKEIKVFSSVPFLNGESPAEKVMGGDNPNTIFKKQEQFKDKHNINDDGTKTKRMGGLDRNKEYSFKNKLYSKGKGKDFVEDNKYKEGGKKKVDKGNGYFSTGELYSGSTSNFSPFELSVNPGTYKTADSNNIKKSSENNTDSVNTKSINDYNSEKASNKKSKFSFDTIKGTIKNTIDNNPNLVPDIVGTGSNLIGSIMGYKANKKMLNNLEYSKTPIARQAAKLKTKININPQLDKMRESLSAYERDISSNTSSSRVALARKQRGRVANILDTNELYGKKENIETDLINKDKLNQQAVTDRNVAEYNNWADRKTQFNNAVRDKKAENKVDLIQNITGSIQDVIARTDERRREDNDVYINEITNPNAAKVMQGYGISSKRYKRRSNAKINK